MKKWLTPALLLLLLLFAGLAFADPSNPTISSTAVDGKTDLSIAYLSSIFGTVSGVLYGTSGQMLGKLLYQFNQGLLVVAGCWLGFTVLTMVFKSAISGSFMQQDNKVALILLRIALGFGLLIPNPSTGYTLLQGIVMQVVVQGVKLADQVWEYGLGYMNSGGSLWSRPAQNYEMETDPKTGMPVVNGGLISNSDSKAILGDKTLTQSDNMIEDSGLSLVQQIMSMEACMIQSSIDWEKDQSGSDDFNSTGPQISVFENLSASRYEFPNGYQTGTGSTNISCGSIAWNVLEGKSSLSCPGPSADGSTAAPGDNTACSYSQLALREMIYGLLPAVKKYVCTQQADNSSSSVCSGIENTGDTTYLSDAMMGATLNFINLIDPLARQDVGGGDAKDALKFVNQAKKDGWMTAGRYYWDLLRVEGAYEGKEKAFRNYIPANINVPNVDAITGTAKTKANDLLKATVCDPDPNGNNSSCTTGLIAQVNSDIDTATGASQSGATAPAVKVKKNGLSWLMAIILPGLSEIVSLIMLFSTKTGSLGLGPEPILWLHNIGMTCMSLGGTIWLGTAALLVPLMLGMGICSGVSPTRAMAETIVGWFQPILLGCAGIFFVVGMVLGYYLPLYPYMLFTFGVIGWIIMVIEAMVAAPLVAMGITHPESHDFLGRSQQAVMLLLGVFLRPVLMVIGLFAAMILCQVSLSILLYTFAGFANDIFALSPMSGAPGGDVLLSGVGAAMGNVIAEGKGSWMMVLINGLIVFPMFLIIFALMVYTATTTCFSLIHHLPDYIMTWIGAPQSHGVNAKEMIGEVKGGISAAAGVPAKMVASKQRADAQKKERTADLPAPGGNPGGPA